MSRLVFQLLNQSAARVELLCRKRPRSSRSYRCQVMLQISLPACFNIFPNSGLEPPSHPLIIVP